MSKDIPGKHTARVERGPNSRGELERILTEMINNPDRAGELEKRMHDTFEQERAVMVLDMSGFSRTTMRHGIASFLMMIHQMKLLVKPSIVQAGGVVIKADADNLFCLFGSVEHAIEAAKEITLRLETVNVTLPEEKRLYVSIGIGYGGILNIANEDLFGHEVNIASKLGEDIAECGQVLLTAAAHKFVTGYRFREENIEISGLHLQYFALAD